jgi:hypothetical protein
MSTYAGTEDWESDCSSALSPRQFSSIFLEETVWFLARKFSHFRRRSDRWRGIDRGND